MQLYSGDLTRRNIGGGTEFLPKRGELAGSDELMQCLDERNHDDKGLIIRVDVAQYILRQSDV